MKNKWKVSDLTNAKRIGDGSNRLSVVVFHDNSGEWHNFDVLETKDRIIFGGYTNTGFLESGYILKDGFSTDEILSELISDLEAYYNDGAQYTNSIVFNDRM